MVKNKKIVDKKRLIIGIFIFSVLILLFVGVKFFDSSKEKVIIKTSVGDLVVELDSKNSPETVENFLQYVDKGFYNNTVFHRVIQDFMIQGGGFDISGNQKKTNPPVKLESNNGLKNEKYTIAMARTNIPNSATSQFFINTKDNTFLDYSAVNPGYAVFGKVVSGQNVVDAIEKVQTETKSSGMENWPKEMIVIYSIERL